jgi:hypothetical protein
LTTACLGWAATELSDAAFVFGPKKFREGDSIVIQQVRSASPRLAVGDKVVVRGHYVLASKARANLSLFVTHTKDQDKELVASTQTMELKQGSGDFELSCEVKYTGVLHLSFYSLTEGTPFGGVYFGTAQQTAEIKDWTLSDYEK